MKLKILFLANGRLGSDNYPNVNVGGSIQTWGLCKELVKRGHEVTIVRSSNRKGEEIVEKVKLIGIKFIGIENILSNTRVLFAVFLFFSKFYFSIKSYPVIQKINPDILCFIDRQTAFFPARLNHRKIFIVHSPEALDFFNQYAIHAHKLNAVLFYVIRFLQNKIISKSDYVIVLNNYIKIYLRKKGLNKIIRIPNGIDIENFSNKGDENFILYAGRFDWNKNVTSLVNVFAEVHKLHPDYHLYLVGAGSEEKRIRTLVKENSILSLVKIIPWMPRNKLMKLMSKCSVFILPSFFEVNPVVVLEAMASAKPVIARANMGTMGIIVHGENGYLYSNDEELRKYLETLLSDGNLRKKMGRNARRTVEREYTFSRIAGRYEELFDTLLRERCQDG